MIPEGEINDQMCITLEALKLYLNAHGFRITQYDHHLKIRGDWEDVTAALAEARDEILGGVEKQSLPERAGLRSAV